jgi:hypothetical protein
MGADPGDRLWERAREEQVAEESQESSRICCTGAFS